MRKSDIIKNVQDIEKYKVLIPKAYGAGEDFPHQVVGQPEFAEKTLFVHRHIFMLRLRIKMRLIIL